MPLVNFHPAPGLGELMPGAFVVPNNPITAALGGPGATGTGYIPHMGELVAGQWVVPQNPIMDAFASRMQGLGATCAGGDCSSMGFMGALSQNGMGAVRHPLFKGQYLTKPSVFSRNTNPEWAPRAVGMGDLGDANAVVGQVQSAASGFMSTLQSMGFPTSFNPTTWGPAQWAWVIGPAFLAFMFLSHRGGRERKTELLAAKADYAKRVLSIEQTHPTRAASTRKRFARAASAATTT